MPNIDGYAKSEKYIFCCKYVIVRLFKCYAIFLVLVSRVRNYIKESIIVFIGYFWHSREISNGGECNEKVLCPEESKE